MAKKPVTKEIALDKLETLCSRSEQCEYDLNQKMFRWGLSTADRKDVIDFLRENRFVDDTRYAKSYANDKSRFSSWGPYKVRIELLRKRIKPAVISEALNNVNPQIWKEGLMRCAITKAKNLDLTGEAGYDSRNKLFRYLISRGYPSSSATKAVMMMKRKQEEQHD